MEIFKKLIKKMLSMIKSFFTDFYYFGFTIAHYNFWGEFAYNLNFLPKKLRNKIKKQKFNVIYSYLIENYFDFINDYKDKSIIGGRNDKKIWICWRQGEDKAPEIVKKCISSVREHSKGYDVIVLSKYNYSDYIKLPKTILEKVENKKICIAHLCDIMRMGLLKTYGGIRCDATILVNDNIFERFNDKNINSICPGKGIPKINGFEEVCSFLIGGSTNKLFSFAYEFFLEYMKREKRFISYFLIDYILYIGYSTFEECKKDILGVDIQGDNILTLIKYLNKKYIAQEWAKLCKIPISKLNWKEKFKNYDNFGNLTNYGKLMEVKSLRN